MDYSVVDILALLGVAVTVLIVFCIVGSVAEAGMYWLPTVVVLCFGAWQTLRRREAPRCWRSGTITFCSMNNRLRFARSWVARPPKGQHSPAAAEPTAGS